MANVKKIIQDWSETGKTVYCIVRREIDSYRLNDADGSFAVNPADPYLSLAEDSVIKGRYEVSESRQAWNNGLYTIAVYKQAGGSPVPASDTIIGTGEMYMVSDAEIVLDASVAAISQPTGTNTVTIKTLTAGLLAIPDAEIVVENNLSQVIATGVTDADGEFELNLDDGAYVVKPRKSMVNFPASQSIVVDSLNLIFTITGSLLMPTVPSVGLQTIYGTVLNIDKSYAASKKVDAYIQEPQIISAAFLTKMILNDTTDANGYFELQIIKGAEIMVTIEGHGSKHIIVTSDDMKDLSTY